MLGPNPSAQRRRRAFVIDPEELVDRIRAPRRAPPPLEVGGLPNARLRIRQADTLQELRHESQVLEARSPHLPDRKGGSSRRFGELESVDAVPDRRNRGRLA